MAFAEKRAEALRVGAGRREIHIPEDYMAVEGFRVIHDPVHARAVAIEAEELCVVVSLEMTSLMGDEVEVLRKMTAERVSGASMALRPESVWTCATHSFSSPHVMPDGALHSDEERTLRDVYREAVQSAVVEAAAEAVANLAPASLYVGRGSCGIVANRDVETPDGWWIGTNGAGETDRTVTVFRFDDEEGKIVAVITHFAMQSSVMDQSEAADGGKIVTTDVAGMTCAEIEKETGAVAMFLIGAAGDQAPVKKAVTETFVQGERVREDMHEAGLAVCAELAGKLAAAALAAAGVTPQDGSAAQSSGTSQDGGAAQNSGTPVVKMVSAQVQVPAKLMNGNVQSLKPVKEAVYTPDGERTMTIDALRLGDITLLGVKPELNCVTARDIAAKCAPDDVLVCTMVNGAAKYMADKEAYDSFRYEALNSPWARGAAEILAEAGVSLIKSL